MISNLVIPAVTPAAFVKRSYLSVNHLIDSDKGIRILNTDI